MSEWLIGGVAVVYLIAAAGYWYGGQIGFAVAYAAYALANVGLIIAAIETRP